MSSKDAFLRTVRQALGRDKTNPPKPDPALTFYTGSSEVMKNANSILERADAGSLKAELEERAVQAGWKVARAGSGQEVVSTVAAIAKSVQAKSILCSEHEVLKNLNFVDTLAGPGLSIEVMALDSKFGDEERKAQRQSFRQKAETADIGVTGVDYAVAETGTCVQLSGRGVSRLVSLLPPIYIAIVKSSQILPSLDELFVVRRRDYLQGKIESSMSLISGPSRSADIENVLVTGVHGPGEVHMIILE